MISPLPSAQLFLAAGLLDLDLFTLAFFVGRLVGYSLYVGLAVVANRIPGTCSGRLFGSLWSITLQVLLLGAVCALPLIDWRGLLNRRKRRTRLISRLRTRTLPNARIGRYRSDMAQAKAPSPTTPQYLGVVGLAAAIGIPAALLAALFLAFVHQCEHWLWTDLPSALGYSSPPWYLVIALPIVGAGVVWVARAGLPGDGGHSPLLGVGGGATPWRFGPGIALAAIGTLGFGAVLGPEAPLIALGSVVGMVAVAFVKVSQRSQAVLATAGSFSAISALFGGPLVAGFMLLEGGIDQGAALLPALIPGLVAAAVGYVLFVGLGNWSGLGTPGLTEPGLAPYHGTHIADLLLAIAVGAVTAVVIIAVRRGATALARLAERRWVLVLFAGAAAVGAIAELARLLGANSQDVLFSGQSSVPGEVATTSAATLLVLLVAKAIGYGISLGCGFRGGPVFPAIFLGVAVASFAEIWLGTSATWAVAVGAAAGMAAGTRLVFTAILFSGLLVGTNGLDTIPAAVFAVVAAWLTAAALDQIWPDRFDTSAAETEPTAP